MTNLELLDILGNIKGEYILQAQSLRSGEKKTVVRKMSRKRALLIAAVISLLLLLVGCAAVLISLQKVSLGHWVFTGSWNEPFEMDVISLNGYTDSPEYRATLEWMEFENSYDPDKALLHQADVNHYMPSSDYESYTCYTEEMRGKIDGICQKYDLELAGPIYFPEKSEQALEAVNVSSIENENSILSLYLNEGRYFRSGSFYLGGTLQDRLAEEVDWDATSFQYFANKKKVFFTNYLTTGSLDSFDVWEYTVRDGTRLLLAQNEERGLIYADTDELFTSVVLYFKHEDAEQPGSHEGRAAMERIADTFRYALTPQKPTAQWLKVQELSENSDFEAILQEYQEYYRSWMTSFLGSDAYSPECSYMLVDMDYDGMDEMLIWNARTGLVYEVVTHVNGIHALYSFGNGGNDAMMLPLYLCVGNILEKDCGSQQGKQLNEYYRLQDSQLVHVETVMEDSNGKFYWSESGGASGMMWAEITEVEYNTIREQHTRIGVPQVASPIDETFTQKVDEYLLDVIQNQELFFSWSYGNSLTLSEYCQQESERMGFPVEITRYAFVDMDGDGVREAVVDFRFGENSQVMCMVLKFESHNAAVSGTEFYIRQMNDIKEDGSFYSSNGWSRLRFNQTNSQWETVLAEDGSSKTEIQWTPFS